MRKKYILPVAVSLILLFFIFFQIIIINKNCHIIRIDNIPIVGLFIRSPGKIIVVNGDYFDSPITSDMLKQTPDGYYEKYKEYWFNAINQYTLNLLIEYMDSYNMAIVPKEYVINRAWSIERLCMELDFVELE